MVSTGRVFLCLLASLSCAVRASDPLPASGSGVSKTAARGESFVLGVDQSASIDGGALVVGFIRVTSDSRCPRGDQCLSEGDATVRIWVQPKAMDREAVSYTHLTLPTSDLV